MILNRRELSFRKFEKIDSLSLKGKCCGKLMALLRKDITRKWRRRNNIEMEALKRGSNILKVIKRERPRQADHAWKKQNYIQRSEKVQNPGL